MSDLFSERLRAWQQANNVQPSQNVREYAGRPTFTDFMNYMDGGLNAAPVAPREIGLDDTVPMYEKFGLTSPHNAPVAPTNTIDTYKPSPSIDYASLPDGRVGTEDYAEGQSGPMVISDSYLDQSTVDQARMAALTGGTPYAKVYTQASPTIGANITEISKPRNFASTGLPAAPQPATPRGTSVNVTDEDMDALARVAQSEVGHFKGKERERALQGVVDTILNRAAATGKSITEVVNAKNQFSAVSGSRKAVGSWDRLPEARTAIKGVVEKHVTARQQGAPSIIGKHKDFANPAALHEASPATKKAVLEMAKAPANTFGNKAKGDYHVHGSRPGSTLAPDYTVTINGVASPTAKTLGSLAWSPEARPSGQPGVSYSPDTAIAGVDQGAPIETASIDPDDDGRFSLTKNTPEAGKFSNNPAAETGAAYAPADVGIQDESLGPPAGSFSKGGVPVAPAASPATTVAPAAPVAPMAPASTFQPGVGGSPAAYANDIGAVTGLGKQLGQAASNYAEALAPGAEQRVAEFAKEVLTERAKATGEWDAKDALGMESGQAHQYGKKFEQGLRNITDRMVESGKQLGQLGRGIYDPIADAFSGLTRPAKAAPETPVAPMSYAPTGNPVVEAPAAPEKKGIGRAPGWERPAYETQRAAKASTGRKDYEAPARASVGRKDYEAPARASVGRKDYEAPARMEDRLALAKEGFSPARGLQAVESVNARAPLGVSTGKTQRDFAQGVEAPALAATEFDKRTAAPAKASVGRKDYQAPAKASVGRKDYQAPAKASVGRKDYEAPSKKVAEQRAFDKRMDAVRERTAASKERTEKQVAKALDSPLSRRNAERFEAGKKTAETAAARQKAADARDKLDTKTKTMAEPVRTAAPSTRAEDKGKRAEPVRTASPSGRAEDKGKRSEPVRTASPSARAEDTVPKETKAAKFEVAAPAAAKSIASSPPKDLGRAASTTNAATQAVNRAFADTKLAKSPGSERIDAVSRRAAAVAETPADKARRMETVDIAGPAAPETRTPKSRPADEKPVSTAGVSTTPSKGKKDDDVIERPAAVAAQPAKTGAANAAADTAKADRVARIAERVDTAARPANAAKPDGNSRAKGITEANEKRAVETKAREVARTVAAETAKAAPNRTAAPAERLADATRPAAAPKPTGNSRVEAVVAANEKRAVESKAREVARTVELERAKPASNSPAGRIADAARPQAAPQPTGASRVNSIVAANEKRAVESKAREVARTVAPELARPAPAAAPARATPGYGDRAKDIVSKNTVRAAEVAAARRAAPVESSKARARPTEALTTTPSKPAQQVAPQRNTTVVEKARVVTSPSPTPTTAARPQAPTAPGYGDRAKDVVAKNTVRAAASRPASVGAPLAAATPSSPVAARVDSKRLGTAAGELAAGAFTKGAGRPSPVAPVAPSAPAKQAKQADIQVGPARPVQTTRFGAPSTPTGPAVTQVRTTVGPAPAGKTAPTGDTRMKNNPNPMGDLPDWSKKQSAVPATPAKTQEQKPSKTTDGPAPKKDADGAPGRNVPGVGNVHGGERQSRISGGDVKRAAAAGVGGALGGLLGGPIGAAAGASLAKRVASIPGANMAASAFKGHGGWKGDRTNANVRAPQAPGTSSNGTTYGADHSPGTRIGAQTTYNGRGNYTDNAGRPIDVGIDMGSVNGRNVDAYRDAGEASRGGGTRDVSK